MEEHKILRRNHVLPLPVEIHCEKINGDYKVWTNCPMGDSLKYPVIKENGSPFSEHPLLRPFDKFLLDGNPKIGTVTYIFILHQKINRPTIVCAIVETENRILLLPAWGLGLMKPVSKQNIINPSPVAHMTIDIKSEGDFKIHYTGPNKKNGKKVRIYHDNKLNMKNEHCTHIGTLGVNELMNLDPLGIVYRILDCSILKRYDTKEIEQILQDSLSPPHPLLKLPPEFIWDENSHLEISFALIGNKLNNDSYIKDYITPPEKNAVEQLNRIPLKNNRSLLITFTICHEKLNHTFLWKRSKRQEILNFAPEIKNRDM